MPDAFYLPESDVLVPTKLSVGPWSADAQHGGPPSALVARAMERCEPREGWRIARIAIDILGPVPLAPVRATATVARSGRSVELLEGSLGVRGGREMLRARAWRVRTSELGIEVGDGQPPAPGPEHGTAGNFLPGAPDEGYHTAMDFRMLEGGFDQPGPARAWLRQRQPLVAGEDPSPLQRVLVVADAGNGLSSALDFRRYVYVNTDLIVQLVRPVEGEWVFVDARTLVARDGVGLAETTLGDRRGRAGRGMQTLFVSAREP